jgi:hypothetical protein
MSFDKPRDPATDPERRKARQNFIQRKKEAEAADAERKAASAGTE